MNPSPCPWCETPHPEIYTEDWVSWVQCLACGARGPRTYHDDTEPRWVGRAAAVADWNRVSKR